MKTQPHLKPAASNLKRDGETTVFFHHLGGFRVLRVLKRQAIQALQATQAIVAIQP